jgi:hypothetical protein
LPLLQLPWKTCLLAQKSVDFVSPMVPPFSLQELSWELVGWFTSEHEHLSEY